MVLLRPTCSAGHRTRRARPRSHWWQDPVLLTAEPCPLSLRCFSAPLSVMDTSVPTSPALGNSAAVKVGTRVSPGQRVSFPQTSAQKRGDRPSLSLVTAFARKSVLSGV